MQKLLGHADPGFTLRTYVHLLPEDLPEPDVRALKVGNGRATQATEMPRTGTEELQLETGDLQEELSAALAASGT